MNPPFLFSPQSEFRMAFVVPDNHHASKFRLSFIEKVVRESLEISASQPAVRWVKSEWVPGHFGDCAAQLIMELVFEPRRDVVVIMEDVQHVPLSQRVVDHFHCLRSRSIPSQNSVSEIGCARPESNSSRLRTASSRLAVPASSSLEGGSESSSQAASFARSFSGRPETFFWISATDMRIE